MEKFKKRFVIRDSEAGNPIEDYDFLQEASFKVDDFIREDEKNGNYEKDFYEIYDQKTGKIYDENLNEKN